jgi:hypothetical protein
LYEISEGEDNIGDRDEGSADTLDGGTAEFKGFVTSCWTKLKGSKPTCDEWDIFKEDNRNVLAIVSSPSKVCAFLNKVLETDRERTKRKFPFHPVKHEEVKYETVHIDHTNIADVVPFRKKAKFIKEQEYRFVLTYAHPDLIDTFIFCGGIDYMETCFVNPNICKKQKEELRLIIMRAMAGYGNFCGKTMPDIIANPEVLCKEALKGR